jgi:hypothetical protein
MSDGSLLCSRKIAGSKAGQYLSLPPTTMKGLE